MTLGSNWDIHYIITQFHLYNIAVCCILSEFLWRYPNDGWNRDWNM